MQKVKHSHVEAVIFDLDGTLIDSAPGILASFASVLREAEITPLMPLDDLLIGPPLRKTLQIITGIHEPEMLDHLTDRFKGIYDETGYFETNVYKGVKEVLSELHKTGIPLAIATNKRRVPTLKILKHLGWEQYFTLVGTLDTPTPAHLDKAALIASLLTELQLIPANTLYVGDKYEDGLAASANNMPFAAAAWGYGEWEQTDTREWWTVVVSPEDICRLLSN